MNRILFVPLALFALLEPLGCSRGEEASAPVSPPGDVPIVTTASLASLPIAVPGEPVGVWGGDRVPFAEVSGAARLPDGRVVVADGGNSVLHVFAPDGRHLATFGGPGDGPSEFRSITSMGLAPGDTVWVHDFANQRMTFVSPNLDGSRSTSLHPRLGSGLAVGVLTDGTTLAGESWSSARVAEAAEPGLNREPVAYVRYSRSGALLDTVALVPGREVVLRLEGGRGVMGPAPLGRVAVHAVTGDRLVVGDEVEHELRVYAPGGRLERVIRWDGGDLHVDNQWVESWRSARLAAAPPEDRPDLERQMADIVWPELRPAFGDLLAGVDGGVWVGEYAVPGAEPRRWLLFDSTGVARLRMVVPERFRPLEIGDAWVLGLERDAFDVETVELRGLEIER